MKAIVVAEEIADRYGDLNQFKNDFSNARATKGIMDSIENALKLQNLWEIYQARG